MTSAMQLDIRDYDLDDRLLLEEARTPFAFLVWRPAQTVVVIGKGNRPELAVFSDAALADGVPVLRRPSGGEAVILSPEMLCVSAVRNTTRQQPSPRYFRHYNGLIIRALQALRIDGVGQQGISDLAVGGRKILGSSIYRNKNRVFYHAVLNVAGRTDLMERYLCMPQRQPDYRRQRAHASFVTSLQELGHRPDFESLRQQISLEFARAGLHDEEPPGPTA